jgi:hypothetical protein
MKIEDRISRWLDEPSEDETESHIKLLEDAEKELRARQRIIYQVES